ncbi:MAG: endolytic transglycosylase MltG [Gemmatimonadetes bacterium]|nr:endolytic transglycosylase MltG [Gemmatimonadota bacterium]
MRASRFTLVPRKPSFAWGPLAVAATFLVVTACWDAPPWSESVEVRVPPGASLSVVADSLAARGILKNPRLFTLWGRIRRLDREIQAGMYAFRPGSGWNTILRDLSRGAVLTLPVTIPEGFQLRDIAERIAPITELEADSVAAILTAPAAAEAFGVPGPTLEGYVFPDTYLFAPGTPLDRVIATLTGRYRAFWTPQRLARADSLGRSQVEITTLASIIEAEAQRAAEMPLISAVYHNRLAQRYPLQADPTVLYAIGEHRTRLLYSDIDAVADHPYNTYTQPGLPPGPIGSPGEKALSAALYPAAVDYLYFVAQGDGSHVFSRTLEEHNRARVAVQRDTVSP